VLDVCCGSGDLSFLLSNKVASNGKASSSFLSLFFCCIMLKNMLPNHFCNIMLEERLKKLKRDMVR